MPCTCHCSIAAQRLDCGCSRSIHGTVHSRKITGCRSSRPGCVLLQGVVLEPAIGSARFAALVAELLLISQALLTLAAAGLSAAAPALFASGYRSTCAIGFSGVLFALKASVVPRCC
jgi:hypothetical protein